MDKRPKLGIIGGMGSVAAAYFFHRLIELTPAKTDQDYIETFVHNNSAVPDRTAGLIGGGPSPLPELIRSVETMNRLEVDYIVLACMTSHHFIEQLQPNSNAKILDGIALASERCHEEGYKKVGVIASAGNIKLGMFQKCLAGHGIEALVFNEAHQATYFDEPIYEDWGVKAGHVTGRPHETLNRGAQLLAEAGAEAIIGGCSELPLVFDPDNFPVPLIDAIDVMLEKAIDACFMPEGRSRRN